MNRKAIKTVFIIMLVSGSLLMPAYSQQFSRTTIDLITELSNKMLEKERLIINICGTLPPVDASNCFNFCDITGDINNQTLTLSEFIDALEFVRDEEKQKFSRIFIQTKINILKAQYNRNLNSMNASLSTLSNSRIQILGSEFLAFFSQLNNALKSIRP